MSSGIGSGNGVSEAWWSETALLARRHVSGDREAMRGVRSSDPSPRDGQWAGNGGRYPDTVTDATPTDAGVDAVSEPTPKPPPSWLLVAAGTLTLVSLALALVAWIDVHVEVWEAAARCSGSFVAPAWARGLASIIAGTSMTGLAISGLWLGLHPGDRRARRLFWAAILLAWVGFVAMALFAGHEISECSVL